MAGRGSELLSNVGEYSVLLSGRDHECMSNYERVSAGTDCSLHRNTSELSVMIVTLRIKGAANGV